MLEERKQQAEKQQTQSSAPATPKTETKKEDTEVRQTLSRHCRSDVQNWAEANMAPAAGTVDFVTDTLNLIPNVNIPKMRPFETTYGQSQENASFVVQA